MQYLKEQYKLYGKEKGVKYENVKAKTGTFKNLKQTLEIQSLETGVIKEKLDEINQIVEDENGDPDPAIS